MLLNASGSPVATKIQAIQIDIPVGTEQAFSIGATNWGAVLAAAIQLVIAMMTGSPTAIAAAIQALINAFMS